MSNDFSVKPINTLFRDIFSMLKAYHALKTIEEVVSRVYSGVLRVRRLNDEQIIVEILESRDRERG